MLFLNILCGLWVANNVHNMAKSIKDDGLVNYVISTSPAVQIIRGVRGLQENESLKDMFGKEEQE